MERTFYSRLSLQPGFYFYSMKITAVLLLLFLWQQDANSQSDKFPASWAGHWRGTLSWYSGNTIQQVNMQLIIAPTDTATAWNWQLVYGDTIKDNRPYLLIEKDSATNHWVIDEKNGIVLDQYYMGDRLSGVFTFQNTTILNTYWIEEERMHIEFYAIAAKPVAVTGKGSEESPAVSSYKVNSFQKAMLTRIK